MENRETNAISDCCEQNRDWKNLKIDDKEHVICFIRESDSWKVFLTNLIEIYTETLTDKAMFNKCKSVNHLLTLEAFDWKKLVLKMLNDIPQYVRMIVREVAACRMELRIDIPKIDVKLKFPLDLVKGTPQQFFEIVTLPLCVSSVELVRRYRVLLDLVKRKDEEIAEYKAEGAQLLRKYIATKPFSEELFHDNDVESVATVETFQSVIHLYKEINSSRLKLESKMSSNDGSVTRDLKTDENALSDLSTNEPPAQAPEENKLGNDEQVHSKIEESKVGFSSSKTSVMKISNISHAIHKAWYTGQRAEKIPSGLIGVVGHNCLGLDLSYNELTSVFGVKDFGQLQELILDNNNLDNLKTLPYMATLTTLSLNNNKISNIDKALDRIRECCPNVEYVSLLGNPGCPDQLTNPSSTDEDDYERYRLYAIHILPASLRFLDSRKITQQERLSAKARGRYSKTVRLVPELIRKFVPSSTHVSEFDDIHFNIHYTPLPSSLRNPQDHRGAYGKCKYRYSGKNSEGNRFISNSDL